jgi:hypothetical protein
VDPNERLTFVLENGEGDLRPRAYDEDQARTLFIETGEFWRR